MGFYESRVECENHIPRPAGHSAFDAAEDPILLKVILENKIKQNHIVFINGYSKIKPSKRMTRNTVVVQSEGDAHVVLLFYFCNSATDFDLCGPQMSFELT